MYVNKGKCYWLVLAFFSSYVPVIQYSSMIRLSKSAAFPSIP